MGRVTRAIWALAACTLLAAGCGGDDGEAGSAGGADGTGDAADEGAGADEPCSADRAGGELAVGQLAPAPSLDTYNGASGNIQSGYEVLPLYGMLMRYDEEADEFVPDVAESLEPNDDNTVWTLHLRPEVTFGNGDPLDADAMVAHLDRHLGPESLSRLREQGAVIAGYEKVDEWTVQFTLTGPYGRFPVVLTTGLGMVQNTRVIEARGDEAFQSDATGAGVGPFELESYDATGETVLRAKEDWWGGPVCIETLRIVFIPGVRSTWEAMQNGEVDLMVYNRDPETEAEIRDEADNYREGLNHGAGLLFMNQGVGGYDGPLTDPRVRQALAYSIDTEAVVDRAFAGGAVAQTGLISSEAERLEPTEGLEYDPDRARDLLDEVKEETGWDGSFTALCGETPQANLESCLTIQGMHEAVGFEVELETVTVTEIIQRVYQERNFELVHFGVINPELMLWSSYRQFYSDNPLNAIGYANPAADAALDDLREAEAPDDMSAAFADLQEVWNEDVPAIPVFATRDGVAYRDGINGIEWHNTYTPVFDHAWLAQ
jgi:peptide/nickel transport system substrate-binding protein